ncbi:MAG: hypothetical protein U1A06_10185, partial [Hoeflea sp.]|nr:hypothetical protein [Hoeflea sp.]
ERREEFYKLAQKNLARVGLSHRVEQHLADIEVDGFQQTGADALFLDVREPQDCLRHIPAAVTPGATCGFLLPTVNQVSDLLRGASREEQAPARAPAAPRAPERNPRHVVESLNSLSVDIARAIDHDASVDLWRRYQRGERDVFTRRLYTLKGQQTFEEIKSKYGREPEFRAAVDRYIADFEKLLSDVARNDRDNMMTQTYLTSDTGKVYTMLAHASGRFGGQER